MNIVFIGGTEGIGSYLASHRHLMGDKTLALGRGTTIPIDVRDAASVNKAARSCWQILHTIDAVVITAAVHGPIGNALMTKPSDWADTIAVNLLGSYHVVQAFAPYLKDAMTPRVICFAGGGAHQARPGFCAYGVSKAALVRMVETIALEEFWLGINILSPGVVRTRLTEEIIANADRLPAREKETAERAREGSIKEQMARVFCWVDFLLSEESNGISGRWFSCVHDRTPNEMPELLAAIQIYPDAFTLRRNTKAE